MFALFGGQGACGFIKNYNARICTDRACDLDHLLLARRQLGERHIDIHIGADLLQQRPGPVLELARKVFVMCSADRKAILFLMWFLVLEKQGFRSPEGLPFLWRRPLRAAAAVRPTH